jgi:hypothetical protein
VRIVPKPVEERFWNYYFKKKFGFLPKHAEIKSSLWTVAVWHEDEIMSQINVPEHEHDGKLTASLEKILDEYRENPRTTIRPRQIEADIFAHWGTNWGSFGRKKSKQDDIEELRNILVNNGMNRSAQLNTGQSTVSWLALAFGTGSNAETVGDTALQTETVRKLFTNGGNRVAVNQTEKYSMVLYSTDITPPVTFYEAGVFDQGTLGGTMYCRLTYTAKTINTGDLMTAQINVTHVNGTVT